MLKWFGVSGYLDGVTGRFYDFFGLPLRSGTSLVKVDWVIFDAEVRVISGIYADRASFSVS